jgi:hypothetical protein
MNEIRAIQLLHEMPWIRCAICKGAYEDVFKQKEHGVPLSTVSLGTEA